MRVVLVGVEEVDFGDFVLLDPAGQNLGVAMGSDPIAQSMVKDAVAVRFQGRRVVAHGRVKQGELLLVVTEVPGPWGRLDHPDQPILGRGRKQGMIGKELIPEDPDQAHLLILKQSPVSESKNGLFCREREKE